nr:helix-turn-helix transcriptional regulator [Leucobacter chinensis]
MTEGPAYGLQLRGELTRRLPRERPINVGQVYSTLDRLVRDGFAEQRAQTDDGLPLYAVTDAGRALADSWLTEPIADEQHPWETMLAQVAMAVSLPGRDADVLLNAYETLWQARLDSVHDESPGQLAQRHLALAALSWLAELREVAPQPFAVSHERPPRGRPRQ